MFSTFKWIWFPLGPTIDKSWCTLKTIFAYSICLSAVMLQEIQEHILWHPLGFIIVSKSVSPCSVTPFFDLSCWISTPETVKCTSYTLICDVHVSHIQFVNWFYGVYSKIVVFKWSLLGFMLYFALLKLLSQTRSFLAITVIFCHFGWSIAPPGFLNNPWKASNLVKMPGLS